MNSGEFDLTEKVNEPNGSPMPLNDQPQTTLGGLVYFALTRTQAKDDAEAERAWDLAKEIVGKASFTFATKDLAMTQRMVKSLPQTCLRVPGGRMLELKGKAKGDGAT